MTESTQKKKMAGKFFQQLDKLLARPHPSVTEPGRNRQARLLAWLSIAYLVLVTMGFVATILLQRVTVTIYFLILLIVLTLVSYVLSRTKYYPIGSALLISSQLIAGFAFLAFNPEGSMNGILSSIIPSLILASVFLTSGWVIVLTAASALGIYLLPIFNPTISWSPLGTAGILLVIGSINVIVMVFRNRVEQERIAELQTTNQELREIKDGLEDRIRERTTELDQRSRELENANIKTERRAAQFEAIAQVAQAIASLQNLITVLSSITDSISKQFGYYHVGVFLIEETGKFAVLTASNSTGGKNMLARGHRLEVGKVGIVGYAAGQGEARIALDTGNDAIFFNNPDLPKTRSEMALPLRSGKRTIGVLDVQSTEANAFGNEDIETLSILAEQVSLAIDNSRLFEQTQRALAESELLNRQYIRQEWERLPQEQKLAGYRYNVTGTSPLETPVEIPGLHRNLQKGELLQTPGVNGQPARLTVPVQIRGETIGVLNIQSPEVTEWNQDQIEIARAVAERVALSAENARLFEETSRRAERERTVSRITTNIRSTNDPQVMLQTALEELKHALGATDITIRPYMPPTRPVARRVSQEKNSRKKTVK